MRAYHIHAARALAEGARAAHVVPRGVEVGIVEAGAGLEDEGGGEALLVVGGVVGAAGGGRADLRKTPPSRLSVADACPEPVLAK